jgi:hypothetical protein
MDKNPTEVIYREDEDILIVRFASPRPAITLELGDGTLVRVDPETKELLAIEVLNWTERMETMTATVGNQKTKKNGVNAKHSRRPKEAFLPRGLVPA